LSSFRCARYNKAPDSVAEASIQARRTRTGHVSGFEPYGIPTLRPWPSWSVLERRNVTTTPSDVKAQSSISSPASSDRRKAPANPSSNTARSRISMPASCDRGPCGRCQVTADGCRLVILGHVADVEGNGRRQFELDEGFGSRQARGLEHAREVAMTRDKPRPKACRPKACKERPKTGNG
jgi:hypothetical protein